jgi:hypothetical protein
MSNFKREHLEVFRFRKDECQVPQTGLFLILPASRSSLRYVVVIDESRPLIVYSLLIGHVELS